ncbi:phospho-sugar mutase [bacterium]|nr:phospho-sugar mutase [bacterium]MDA7901462.1 phospho-sugar mutase [bacterium]
MTDQSEPLETKAYIQRIKEACEQGLLTEGSVENLICWLTEDRYAQYAPAVIDHIKEEKWDALDDVFWTVIPFGTGGRRGKMYPFGSNAINERTIGESAQGLAEYVKETKPDGPWKMAIAYDTRHRSREFAELCASVMVANGFEVFFIDDYRSTPELSFLIRYKNCDCGIMVTASHNPPSDNAVKVYWSNGAQLIPPHDKAVIAKVGGVQEIPKIEFQQGINDGKIHIIRQEIDAALLEQHVQHSFAGPRDLKVIFSPLHGVGEFNVKSLLNAVGFDQLEIYEPHREPNGDFPNVPGHVSNPENAVVFDAIIDRAKESGAELILASDPDCDRMGAAAPVTNDLTGEWRTFNGNQLCALLGDYVLGEKQKNGTLDEASYVVTTLVTTNMLSRICDSYQVRCSQENLVGFKWICNVMDVDGPEHFVFGTEESHGFLVGQYCRDKDGAIACLLMTELAALVKSKGKSLFEHLDDLYLQHGFHHERLVNIRMEGSDGMKRMQNLMANFRSNPPTKLGDLDIVGVRDYQTGKRTNANGEAESMTGPTGNVLIFETSVPGNYVAARPSGTEPKVKFYMFTYVAPEGLTDLAVAKQEMETRIDGYAADMQMFADKA